MVASKQSLMTRNSFEELRTTSKGDNYNEYANC